MGLSHYRLSPTKEKKKVVHAGLQVLSTKLCGTAGVERNEHYLHDLSHATALNYLMPWYMCSPFFCQMLEMFMRFLNVIFAGNGDGEAETGQDSRSPGILP